MTTYSVTIVYKGTATYVVEADDEDAAMDLAVDKYQNGEGEDTMGDETIENIEASVFDDGPPPKHVDHNGPCDASCGGSFDN